MEGAFKPLFGTGSRSSSIEDTNDAIRARLSLSGPLPNITELYEAEEQTDYENLSSNDANNRVSFKDGGAQLNRDNSANYGSDLDDRAKALLQSYMTENYGDYLTASQPSSVPPDEIHQPPQPHYLSETFASRAPDYSAQAEAERLSNTFRTGSHWSIKNLPNYFEPGSIRGERKAHAMTNLLGTAMTKGPDGLGMRAFLNSTSNSYFSRHEYITTDYNKNTDLHKAQLEEERNLNASFSRKPFKTASLVRLAPPVPHNFGVNKKKKKDDEEDENDALNEDPMIGVSARERQAFMRTAIKRKILDLKLGKLVRNEYGAQEKEKFLAGHFCYQNGNISVVGDRIQIRKSLAAMRSWSKKIFTDLAEDWPNLKFKIMLQNTVKTKKKGIGGFGKKIDLEGSGLTNFGSPSTQSFLDADGALRRPEEGADELLVQFETEGQSLPPEEALNRYMVHMATHGRASEFGLLRRCDRWGVLEKGLVQAEIPRVSTDKILIKIEEYSVKKVETSKIRQSDDGVECLDGDKITQDLMSNLVGALKTASREEKKRQNNNDVTGGRQNNNDVTGNNGNGIISAGSSTKEGSSNKEGSLNKEGSSTEVQDPLGPVWYDSTRERTKEETDDKKNLRVLLYRSIEMNNADISNYIFRALKKAKVEPQLDSPDLTVGDTGMAGSASSRGQSQSARARGQESARGYSRGLDSSRAISISIAAAAALLLNTTIHVVCVTKDQPECQPDDLDNVIDPNTTTVTATSTVPVRYDINGHIQKENDLTPIPTLKKKKKAVQPHVLCGGFQTLFEEGSSVPGLFDSLAKSFSVVLQLDPTKSMSEKEGSKTSNNSNSVSPSVPIHTIEEGEFRRDIKLVVTYTGKWTPVLTAEKIKKPEVLSSSTSPGSRINSTTISRDQNEERDEDDDENEEGYTPIMTARSIGASNLIDTLETDVSTAAPVPMSLRTLLRTTREFSTSEQGRGYLHSHKEKLKEKERINILASEELKKLDCQTAISTAKKRQIVLQFSICHSDDANIISEKIIQCIAKGAGLSPYHPVEYKSRKNSFRSDSVILSGHDTPNAFPPSTKKFPQPTGKTRSEDKKSPTVADDNEILEVRSDGMRETNLFTFSFYAPWIKISQMNASKKEANDFRLKARETQKDERRKKATWKRRAEQVLFGTNVDPRLSELTLQAGGGLEGMKWLLADMVDKNGNKEYTDILSQMPLTARKPPLGGSASFINSSAPSSQRQSFSNLAPLSDRAPSFSNPSNVVGQLAAKLAALHIRRGSKLLTASSSSSNTRKNSVAYTGVKGNMEERSLLRSGGNVCELGLLRDGSMQAVYTEASAQDSEPEVKYRAIRHLKLVVYDDAKVIMSRKSLKSGGSDLDSPRDGDRSIWSPKETPISWTPLPGQKLNRWNTTF